MYRFCYLSPARAVITVERLTVAGRDKAVSSVLAHDDEVSEAVGAWWVKSQAIDAKAWLSYRHVGRHLSSCFESV